MAEIPVVMPKMSMTMEEGTVVSWAKNEGDEVRTGDVIAEVLTDKVDMEVEAPADGTLARIVAQVDDVVAVGEPIAFLTSESESLLGDLFGGPADAGGAETQPAPDGAAPDASVTAGTQVPADTPASATTGQDAAPSAPAQPAPAGAAEPAPSGEEPPAVPLARHLARKAGIDLRTITPTGPHGTVRVPDVKDAIARAEQQQTSGSAVTVAAEPGAGAAAAGTAAAGAPSGAAAGAGTSAPVVEAGEDELLGDRASRRIRVATAKAMEPTALVPQFTVYRALELGTMARARKGPLQGISWTTILIRAYAMALRQYPLLNGFWAGNGIKGNDRIGVTIAVDTPRGLLVPVVADPDLMTAKELNRRVKQIAEDARTGSIDPAQFQGGTATVSNLGGMGIERFGALVTPPQATALSLGAVDRIPVFDEDGSVIPRTVVQVGLSVDHRVGDGADAARLLQAMQEALADPVEFLA